MHLGSHLSLNYNDSHGQWTPASHPPDRSAGVIGRHILIAPSVSQLYPNVQSQALKLAHMYGSQPLFARPEKAVPKLAPAAWTLASGQDTLEGRLCLLSEW